MARSGTSEHCQVREPPEKCKRASFFSPAENSQSIDEHAIPFRGIQSLMKIDVAGIILSVLIIISGLESLTEVVSPPDKPPRRKVRFRHAPRSSAPLPPAARRYL
jgi:hypothetical protein